MSDGTVPFLSAPWFDLACEFAKEMPATRPPVPSHRVCQVVTGTPGGEVRYLVTITDGRITAFSPLPPKSADDADVVLTTTFDDAVGLAKGTKNPAVLFMQGKMKTAGDPGLTLDYLRLASEPGWLARIRELAGRTDFEPAA